MRSPHMDQTLSQGRGRSLHFILGEARAARAGNNGQLQRGIRSREAEQPRLFDAVC